MPENPEETGSQGEQTNRETKKQDGSPILGRLLPEDDVTILKRVRESFLPDATVKDQDTYAKWLFGLTTTIAALGTGFSHAAFSKLSSWGIFFYAVAVLAAGCGLALALWTLSEEPHPENWAAPEEMLNSLGKLVSAKKRSLRGATICLAASLVAAAGAPLVTTIEWRPSAHPSGMTVRISERALEAGVELNGLRPSGSATLEVDQEQAGKTGLLAVFHQVADSSGSISAKMPEIKLTPLAQNLKLELTYERDGLPVREEKEFSIPAAPCPGEIDPSVNCKKPPQKSRPNSTKPGLSSHPGCPAS